MINYRGKNVIVTGASGGMGIVLCKKLAASIQKKNDNCSVKRKIT